MRCGHVQYRDNQVHDGASRAVTENGEGGCKGLSDVQVLRSRYQWTEGNRHRRVRCTDRLRVQNNSGRYGDWAHRIIHRRERDRRSKWRGDCKQKSGAESVIGIGPVGSLHIRCQKERSRRHERFRLLPCGQDHQQDTGQGSKRIVSQRRKKIKWLYEKEKTVPNVAAGCCQ